MNKRLIIFLFIASAAVAIAGVIEQKHTSWHGGNFSVSIIAAVFCFAFGRILILDRVLDSRSIKLGSETLPPSKDVAAVLVHGEPISEEAKKTLLKAIRKAKRATSSGNVSKELSFQIVDRWGGVWDLQAYKEAGGARGFSANRVFYSGRAAEIVAACVGL